MSALILFCFVACAKAQPIEVTATGESHISYDDALTAAFKKAVEDGLGVYISSEQRIKNFELICDNLLKNASGYVKKYEIVSKEEADGVYKVTIKAEVAKDDLLKEAAALKIMFDIKGNPRLMVMIDTSELKAGGAYDLAAQTAVTEKFIEKGFLCVDPNRARAIRNKEKIQQALQGNIKGVKALGMEEDADVVIAGKAYKEPVDEIYGLKPYRVCVTGNAVWTSTGNILHSAKGAGADPFGRPTEALIKASQMLADEFIAKIIEKWNEDIVNTSLIQIYIWGLDYDNFIQFKNTLKANVKGIHSIYDRGYIASGKVGKIEISYDSDTEKLSQYLSTCSLPGFAINIKSRRANKIECSVKRL